MCAEKGNDAIVTSSWLLWAMRWTCEDECKYGCMHADLEDRLLVADRIVKYYGKWPFVRWFGMQEVASTLFSVANAVPHLYFLTVYSHSVPDRYPFRRHFIALALVHINTWIWSAAFHARDTLLTERLDYFCATLGVAFGLLVSLIRLFSIVNPWLQASMAVLFAVGYLAHISYLQFWRFDYGFNMLVTGSVFACYVLSWLVWALVYRRPHAKIIVLVLLLLVAAASLEVFDFPPIWGIFDAHALWHGATPFLSWFTYRFLIADAHDHWRLLQRDKRTRRSLVTWGHTVVPSHVVDDDTVDSPGMFSDAVLVNGPYSNGYRTQNSEVSTHSQRQDRETVPHKRIEDVV